MEAPTKKQLGQSAGKLVRMLMSSSCVVTTLWMVASPHLDNYLEKKMDEFHTHDTHIRLGIIVREGTEWYVGPDGKEHTVIHDEDGFRWWYNAGEMRQIYK